MLPGNRLDEESDALPGELIGSPAASGGGGGGRELPWYCLAQHLEALMLVERGGARKCAVAVGTVFALFLVAFFPYAAGAGRRLAAVQTITAFSDPRLVWTRRPEFERFDEDKGTLIVRPKGGLDYWSKTFYKPLLVKADAAGLLAPVPANVEATLELAFTLHPAEQFDQAGGLVVVDDKTWLKAGIEFCDGVPRLSVVATNDGFSDWSTQATGNRSLRLRVHKLLPGPDQGPAAVVEVARGGERPGDKDEWSVLRIASLRSAQQPWRVGLFAASPRRQRGASYAAFTRLYIGPRLPMSHEQHTSGTVEKVAVVDKSEKA